MEDRRKQPKGEFNNQFELSNNQIEKLNRISLITGVPTPVLVNTAMNIFIGGMINSPKYQKMEEDHARLDTFRQ